MKCPKCKGIGCVGATQDTCLACNGTGEIEQTNEEYLKSLNTEQFAEFLAGIINTNPCGYLLDCNKCGLNDKCREDDYPTSKEAWCEWLKQPHTIKE